MYNEEENEIFLKFRKRLFGLSDEMNIDLPHLISYIGVIFTDAAASCVFSDGRFPYNTFVDMLGGMDKRFLENIRSFDDSSKDKNDKVNK